MTGLRSANRAAASGGFISSTMIVMMIARTPSLNASNLFFVNVVRIKLNAARNLVLVDLGSTTRLFNL
jgi:hypothetical protein